MQIIDIAFDGGRGDLKIDIDKGVLEVRVSDKNPAFPSGAQVNVPLNPIIQKIIDSAPNVFVKWGLRILLGFLDAA